MSDNYIYAVRDMETGKLVRDITSPGRKFWIRKSDCENAIIKYNRYPVWKHGELKLVTFKLMEVTE